MATYAEAMSALRAADAAGNAEDAKRLAAIAQRLKTQQSAPETSFTPQWKGVGTNTADNMVSKAKDKIGLAAQMATGRYAGIEYDKPIESMSTLADYSTLEGEKEKDAWLKQQFGEKGYGKDPSGQFYLTPEGAQKLGMSIDKPRAMEDKSPGSILHTSTWNKIPYDLAAVAGDLPATAGMLAGGAIGGGPILGPAGAGLGAAGGRAVTELYRDLRGFNELGGDPQKNQDESFGRIKKAGALGAVGEVLGRVPGAIGKAVTQGPSKMVGEPARQSINQAMAKGYVPAVQNTGAFPILQREQGAGFQIFGNRLAKQNAETAIKDVRGFLEKSGIPPTELDGAVQQVLSKDTGGDVAGQALTDKAKAYVQQRATLAEKTREFAKGSVDRRLKTIDQRFGANIDNALELARTDIENGKKAVSAQVSPLYEQFEKGSAGLEVTPTGPLKRVADDLEKSFGEAKKLIPPGTQKFIQSIRDLPELVQPNAMNKIRQTAAKDAESETFAKGSDEMWADRFRRAATDALDQAEAGAEITLSKKSDILDSSGKPIVTQIHRSVSPKQASEVIGFLKEANAIYKKEIGRFTLPEVNAIMRDVEAGARVDPERFASLMMQKDSGTKVGNLMGNFTDKTRNEVRGAVWKRLLNDATSEREGIRDVYGNTLLRTIRERRNTLEAVYGKKELAEIESAAKELSASQGTFDPSQLTGRDALGTNIKSMLQTAIKAEKEKAAVLEHTYLSKLAKPGTEAQDAMSYAFAPGKVDRIKAVKQFYGESSPEFQKLQQASMQKLLGSMVSDQASASGALFTGHALQSTLNEYGKRTIEEMFGPQTYRGLKEFADITQFIFAKQGKGGSIQAAQWALSPLHNLGKLGETWVLGRLMASPKFVNWLVNGVKPGPMQAKALEEMQKLMQLQIASYMQSEDHR